MSNKRQDGQTADAAVSAVYRELSAERAPEQLNARILAAARGASRRSSYSRSIRWTRPLAWAATITLSLAILLQMTDLPEPDGRPLAVPGTPRADASRVAEPALEEARVDDSRLEENQPSRETDAVEKQSRAEAETVMRDVAPAANPGSGSPGETPQSTQRAPSRAPVTFTDQNADMLRQAEDLAEARGGNPSRAAQLRSTGISAAASPDTAALLRCSDASRAAADTWFACIERLQAAGHADAADREFEELTAAFPDFERP